MPFHDSNLGNVLKWNWHHPNSIVNYFLLCLIWKDCMIICPCITCLFYGKLFLRAYLMTGQSYEMFNILRSIIRLPLFTHTLELCPDSTGDFIDVCVDNATNVLNHMHVQRQTWFKHFHWRTTYNVVLIFHTLQSVATHSEYFQYSFWIVSKILQAIDFLSFTATILTDNMTIYSQQFCVYIVIFCR